ncbi:MAG: hypothetical protein R3D62_18210 [Xanthobacteraceae bacterium]
MILLLVLAEAVAFAAYHRVTGRGIPFRDLIANLAAGACLLLALRAALAERRQCGSHWRCWRRCWRMRPTFIAAGRADASGKLQRHLLCLSSWIDGAAIISYQSRLFQHE